ncbi:MAG: hypothetical protein BGO55_08175 [Sphingobacteriales bacterium 50-39]|nr:hypothetical protein [Sphingobacteriales bacterium]OJW53212.1 MAG: hypothetical protein BGO55_08175 [Sphingobacteriales bacterium 50-39]
MKQDISVKACSLLVFILFAVTGHSQTSLNNYKYVIVPERFSFSKEDNQYYLNTTTKTLLDMKGFVAFVGTRELPPSVAGNRCNALTAEVVANNGMFATKLTILLKDCQGNIIFKSKEGKSREKEYPIAYNQALSDAFSSLNDVPYKYDSTIATQQQQAAAPAVAPPPAPAPVPSAVTEITGTLYAQATTNGYQLIDTTPKKVLGLLKTSLQDCFIAEGGASSGMVFKKDGEWIFEYYKDNKLVSQKLAIKF